MGRSINLLKNYPRSKRNLKKDLRKKILKLEVLLENLGKIFLMVIESSAMEVLNTMINFGR